jgi:hypothetical protein
MGQPPTILRKSRRLICLPWLRTTLRFTGTILRHRRIGLHLRRAQRLGEIAIEPLGSTRATRDPTANVILFSDALRPTLARQGSARKRSNLPPPTLDRVLRSSHRPWRSLRKASFPGRSLAAFDLASYFGSAKLPSEPTNGIAIEVLIGSLGPQEAGRSAEDAPRAQFLAHAAQQVTPMRSSIRTRQFVTARRRRSAAARLSMA